MGFGSNSTNAQTSKMLLGYRAQSSTFGVPIPLVYGTQRIPGNVIWTGTLKAIPVQASGGKAAKASSKGGGGTGQSYDYQIPIIIGLCQGPIRGILNAWIDKTKLILNNSTENITIPGGGVPFTPVHPPVADHGAGTIHSYSASPQDYGAPELTVLSGTQSIALKAADNPTPADGEYYFDVANGQYIFNAAQAGLAATISYSWAVPTEEGGQLTPLTSLALELFTGELGQAVWTFLQSNYPGQAIGYSELAYVANQLLDLGQSGMISNFAFEIKGLLPFGAGIIDALPTDIIFDLLTSPTRGRGWDRKLIGDVTQMATYCQANGIFISPLIDTQRTYLDWLGDIIKIANGEAVWSEGVLKLRSYGDTSAIGYGATFDPPTAPEYDLDDDDFQPDGGKPSIQITRHSIEDANNTYSVEWLNRGASYNPEPITASVDWHIRKYGVKPSTTTDSMHAITTHAVAAKFADVQVKRQVYFRNTYTFRLGLKYILLEPMDLVTLTDPYLGLDFAPVRILKIEEDKNYFRIFTCEDFPWGDAKPTLHPKQITAGSAPGFFADPGLTNTPILFEAVGDLTQKIGYVLLMALSGFENWGGCEVHESLDGTTYKMIGQQHGPSRMGFLAADLADHDDPDTTNTLTVDLTESDGELLSVSADDMNNFKSLLLVDGELISYQTAVLVGPNKYALTTLRRGVFGTVITPHKADAPVCSIDKSLFYWKYDTSDIDQNHHFKFPAFNKYGKRIQRLDQCADYQLYIRTPRAPYPDHPEEVLALTSPADPLYGEQQQFSIQQLNTLRPDGSATQEIAMTLKPPANLCSRKTQPPKITHLVLATSGGFIPGGTRVLVSTTATNSVDGLESELAAFQVVDVPVGTDTNQITGTAVAFDVGNDTVNWWAAAGDDSDGLFPMSSNVITDLTPQGRSAPDRLLHHFIWKAKRVWHNGIAASKLLSQTVVAGHSVLKLGYHFADHSLMGRYISIFNKFDLTPLPIITAIILDNIGGSVTLNIDASLFTAKGDSWTIRTKPNIFTLTTIGDSGLVNAANNNTGLTPNIEKGRMVLCIAGPLKGQWRIIKSNTDTTLTVMHAWPVVPDASCIFVIMESGWTHEQKTPYHAFGVAPFLLSEFPLTGPEVWYIQLFSSDESEKNVSSIEKSPWREIYQLGAGVDITQEYTVTLGSVGGDLVVGTDVAPHFHIQVVGATGQVQAIALIVKLKAWPTGSDILMDIFRTPRRSVTAASIFATQIRIPGVALTTTLTGNGGSIDNVQEQFNVSGDLLPYGVEVPFLIQIGSEIMEVTDKGNGTAWTVTRGVNGTTGASHTDGTTISYVNGPVTKTDFLTLPYKINLLDLLTLDVVQVGSGTPGANATLELKLLKLQS